MTTLSVTPGTASDYPGILELNDAAVPHVNQIPLERLAYLHGQSTYLGVARAGDEGTGIAGFLLALDETAEYDSENFGYFKRHYPRFTYVDRIVVSAQHRRAGVGVALYADLGRLVPDDCPIITCEVNVRPANAESLAFHRKMGFEAVDEQETGGGTKRVCLLVRTLRTA